MAASLEELPMLWEFPEVVIERHLLPLLPVPDLFRLRRVCKDTKFLAENYIRQRHANNLPEIEIAQEPDSIRTMASFLALELPFTRVYINNTNIQFYEDPEIPEFLDRYSSTLTHLRVRNFSALLNPKERTFFDAMKNLTHLELEHVNACNWRCDQDRDMKKFGQTSCPVSSSFGNLKSIKFGHIRPYHHNDHGYWENILYRYYQRWEYIGHPRYDYPRPPCIISRRSVPIPSRLRYDDIPIPNFQNSGTFWVIHQLIEYRHENHREEPNLRYYDMENMNNGEVESANCMDFILLAQLCFDRGVKLLNVDAALYHLVGPGQIHFYNAMVIPLISVKNLDKSLFLHELPSLEKVVITATSKCEYVPWWDEAEGKPQWPRLTVLDMTVDSIKMKMYRERKTSVTELYKFLFTEVVRLELVELALRFTEAVLPIGAQVPYPKTRDIKASCPYLKKLTLKNWGGTNKSLSTFWEGLSGLEELVLQDCKELGNVGFVGEDKERPTFFKLTRLKSLTLGGLESMPKVTDTLFDLVIRHMKLSKLFLTSCRPLRNVTSAGINVLLTGDFAKTIEKFPFRGFTLDGLSEEELSELERQFRSYYMV